MTQQKNAKDQIDLQSAALKLAAHGIAITNVRGEIEWVNQAFTRLTGYSQTEVLGHNFSVLKSGEQGPEVFRDLWNTILSGQVWSGELVNRRKDGSLYTEEQTITPVRDEKGRISHFISIMQDITERKQVEETLMQMASIVESSNDAIIGKTLEGTIVSWNKAAEEIYGYKAEEIKGRSIYMIVPPNRTKEMNGILAQLRRGERVDHLETERIRKDGERIYVSLTISPIQDSQGRTVGASAIARDITKRKQSDLELEAVVTIANALRAAPTRAEMLPVVLHQAMRLVKAQGAAMALPDRATGESIFDLATGSMINWTGMRLQAGKGITGYVISTGELYTTDYMLTDTHIIGADLLEDPHAAACIPLIAYEQTIGALWMARTTPFEDSEMRLLTAVADMSANAIHRATLHEQTEQRLSRLAALHTIDEAISSSLDLSVTLGVLLDQVIWQLGVDAADVLWLNPRNQTLDYAARRGFQAGYIPRSRLTLDRGPGRGGGSQRAVGLY